jgi:hypothetical protein
VTAREKRERADGAASSDGGLRCTNPNCTIVLQLAWREIERLRKELDPLRTELARVRAELAHVRAAAVWDPP